MNNESSLRDDSIDILRGIAIIFVVLGHLNPGVIITKFIYSFHIFLFFFISGFLAKTVQMGDYPRFLAKKVKRLLVPFLFWNGISILLYFLISGNISFLETIEQLFFVKGSVGWNSPVWFLLVLFEIELIAGFVCRNRWVSLIVFIVSTAIFIIFVNFNIILPLGLHLVPVGLMFFSLGTITKFIANTIELKTTWRVFLLLVCLCINVLCGVVFNENISVYHVIYHKIYFAIPAAISGVYFFYLLSWFINKTPIRAAIIKFGTHSLLIVCTHYYLLWGLSFISSKCGWPDLWHYTSILKGVGICLILLFLYYASFYLYDRVVRRWKFLKLFI